jgi:hypothetical protein
MTTKIKISNGMQSAQASKQAIVCNPWIRGRQLAREFQAMDRGGEDGPRSSVYVYRGHVSPFEAR